MNFEACSNANAIRLWEGASRKGHICCAFSLHTDWVVPDASRRIFNHLLLERQGQRTRGRWHWEQSKVSMWRNPPWPSTRQTRNIRAVCHTLAPPRLNCPRNSRIQSHTVRLWKVTLPARRLRDSQVPLRAQLAFLNTKTMLSSLLSQFVWSCT